MAQGHLHAGWGVGRLGARLPSRGPGQKGGLCEERGDWTAESILILTVQRGLGCWEDPCGPG